MADSDDNSRRYAESAANSSRADRAPSAARASRDAAPKPVLRAGGHEFHEPSLDQQFKRVRRQQRANLGTSSRWKRFTRRRWFWPLIGVPGIVVVALLLVLSPLIYSSFRAYQTVQVESIEHDESNVVARLNDAGTPELVHRQADSSLRGWNGRDRITILLLGADLSQNGVSRTDTIMLVNIDPEANEASMLSIPRDLRVVIPGYGINKINAAFALGDFNKVQGGGAGLMIRTIEANFGIPIHAFVQIDFNGFVNMIDTVGGIYVDVPYPILDSQYPAENFNYQRIYFSAGWQHLDGEEALIYSRTRHQDGDGARSARQQQVLMALRDQALSLDLLGDLPTLITQFGDSVRTDISVSDAMQLAQLGLDMPRENISQISLLPAMSDSYGDDGTYYMAADWLMVGNILTRFTGSRVAPPGAAIADPDYGASILILNGTNNAGLAGRVGTVLENSGFYNISVDTAEEGGDYETSTVMDLNGNLSTSALITSLINVGQDTIVFGDGIDMSSVDTSYRDYDIVITLGYDAWDPANDNWTLEDYTREQQGEHDTQPVATPTPSGSDPNDDDGFGQ